MFRRTRSASIDLFGTPIRVGVAFALLALLAVAVAVRGEVSAGNATSFLPNPYVHGKAESVEQAAARTARRYLGPLLNTPRVLTKVSVGSCKPAKPDHSRSVYRLCVVEVDGPTADCTLRALVRLFDSGTFYTRASTLRCH
jgi:hypothetical protein